MGKTAKLSIAGDFFRLILNGHKTEEYRAASDYWKARITADTEYLHLFNSRCYTNDAPALIVEVVKIIVEKNKPLRVSYPPIGTPSRRVFTLDPPFLVIKLGRVRAYRNVDGMLSLSLIHI